MENKLFDTLEKLDIKYEMVDHEAVFTCEQAEFVKGLIDGTACKNLFLKNKKHEYFLYVLPDDQRADLKKLGKENGLGNLSFAGEQDLWDMLKLKTGGVTPLGIINDENSAVKVLLSKDLEGKKVLLHPNTNTATVSLKFDDLIKFIKYERNDYALV